MDGWTRTHRFFNKMIQNWDFPSGSSLPLPTIVLSPSGKRRWRGVKNSFAPRINWTYNGCTSDTQTELKNDNEFKHSPKRSAAFDPCFWFRKEYSGTSGACTTHEHQPVCVAGLAWCSASCFTGSIWIQTACRSMAGLLWPAWRATQNHSGIAHTVWRGRAI